MRPSSGTSVLQGGEDVRIRIPTILLKNEVMVMTYHPGKVVLVAAVVCLMSTPRAVSGDAPPLTAPSLLLSGGASSVSGAAPEVNYQEPVARELMMGDGSTMTGDQIITNSGSSSSTTTVQEYVPADCTGDNKKHGDSWFSWTGWQYTGPTFRCDYGESGWMYQEVCVRYKVSYTCTDGATVEGSRVPQNRSRCGRRPC